jgi:tetratricopeptide (TPR) repeat protein
MSVTLSACSNLPSLPSFSNDDAAQTKAPEASETPPVEDENISDTNSAEETPAPTPIVLTPEEMEAQALSAKAQGLMGTLNAFKLDKDSQAKLSPEQLSDVQSAINLLARDETERALVEVQGLIDSPAFSVAPNTAVWVLRGDIHRAKGDLVMAKADYQMAIKLVASNYKAHNRLGLIYRDEGKFDLAKLHYTQAIDAWPGNAPSYRNRGILMDLYVGDKVAALEDYKIYKALLDFQIQSVDSPAKSLIKEQKLARQWILDITRQIKALKREKAND